MGAVERETSPVVRNDDVRLLVITAEINVYGEAAACFAALIKASWIMK